MENSDRTNDNKNVNPVKLEPEEAEVYYGSGTNEIKETDVPGNDDISSKYFCPDHCEGDKTYDEPGNCPVCGMQLVIKLREDFDPGDKPV